MSELEIVRVADRADMGHWHAVNAACFDADHVALPADPVEELYPWLDGDHAGERKEHWLGLAGGDAVAAGELTLPTLDNLTSAPVDVQVRPSWRRRGLGRAMFGHLVERARASGRDRLFLEISESYVAHERSVAAGAGPAFGAAIGARPVLTEVRRLLEVRALDDVELNRLRADAEKHASGYALVQWVGHAPEELLDQLAALSARMSLDPPMEDMEWEPELWTAKRYRQKEDAAIVRGRRMIVTAARHQASGRLVALTEYGLNAGHPDVAYQWDTIVAPDHRGHRLGLLVKLANLALLRAIEPRAAVINTWNAEVNDHMIAINEAMGFRPVERWREWQLDLE